MATEATAESLQLTQRMIPNPEVLAMEDEGNIQAGDLLDPTPELPDDTPLDRVQFPTRGSGGIGSIKL